MRRGLPAVLSVLLGALGLPRFAVTTAAAGAPDLAPTSFTGPTTAVIDRSFDVSWTVMNQGDVSVVVGDTVAITDTVYISTSPTLDASALPIGHRVHSGTRLSPYELPAGASYTETLVVGGHGMPPIATGLHYLFLKTDSTDAVAEADETNNVAGPVSLTLTGVNLVATSITAPPSGTVEPAIPVSWTVENQGDADANGGVDSISLSTAAGQAGLSPSTYSYTGAVAVGASYNQTQPYTLPLVVPGNYFLVVQTQRGFRASTPITIGAAPGLPDLMPTGIHVPDTVPPRDSATAGWSVTNAGSSYASSGWSDNLYLSNDQILDSGDTLLGSDGANTLTTGGTYGGSLTFNAPQGLGTYYLIVVVDAGQVVSESVESNNQFIQSFTVGLPDLVPTSFTGPSTNILGYPFTVSWTVQNQGNSAIHVTSSVPAGPVFDDAVYLSSSSVFDATATEIASVSQPAKRPNGTFAYPFDLPVGGSYTVTETIGSSGGGIGGGPGGGSPPGGITLPTLSPGTYYLFLKADVQLQLRESDETNNVAGPITLIVARSRLVATAFNGPSTGVAEADVALTWTVQNQGNADALDHQSDVVTLSTTPQGGGLGKQTVHTGTLASGDSYTQTQTFTLPLVPPGDYYLVLRTRDSTMSIPITVELPPGLADLPPQQMTVPSPVQVGHAVTPSWTV